jgi:hypothetical protein
MCVKVGPSLRETTTSRETYALVIGLLTFIGTEQVRVPSLMANERHAGPTSFEVDLVETLDSVAVHFDMEYCPAYSYQTLLRPGAEVVMSRRPEPCYRTPEFPPHGPSAVEINQGDGWAPVHLQGWDFKHGNDPLLIQDMSGVLGLLWPGRAASRASTDTSALFYRSQSLDGTWLGAIEVSDPEASDVSSFVAVSTAPGAIEILWTDHREKHLKWPSGPLFDGIPKLFGRSLDGHRLAGC